MRRLRELSRHLALVLYKTYADLRAEAERTYVGFLWWVIEPIVSMGVYYLVFSVFLNRGTEDYVPFLFLGVVPWRWFQTGVVHGANSILAAKSLLQLVYLPKVVFPIVTMLGDTFKFLVVFALLVIFAAAWGLPFSAAYLALPLVMLVQFLFTFGVTLIAASATPFVPDLRIVLDNVIRLWFFLSGVFYDISIFSPEAQTYLRLNPMAVIIEAYRDVVLYGRLPDLGSLGAIAMVGAALVTLGTAAVHRFDYAYPKLRF